MTTRHVRNGLKALVAAGVLLGAGVAWAEQVIFTMTGEVDFELSPLGSSNPFGTLGTGDTVTLSGSYDDAVLTGGSGPIDLTAGANSFMLELGAITLDQNDAIAAELTLADGVPTDFKYVFIFSEAKGSSLDGLDFSFNADSSGLTFTRSGAFDPASFEVVPEPGSLALLAMAGGLVLCRRRR